jgi:D-arginine dehydrogenase
MGMSEITPQEALAIIPILNLDMVDRAAIDTDAWDIDTDLLIQNFAREIRANGGQVVTGAPVKAITRIGTGWQVTAGEQMFEVARVNAAAAWVD